MVAPTAVMQIQSKPTSPMTTMLQFRLNSQTPAVPNGSATNAGAVGTPAAQAAQQPRRPLPVPRAERRHPFDDESLTARKKKAALTANLHDLCSGDYRILMPEKDIPTEYKRPTPIHRNRVEFYDAQDWNTSFLENLKKAVEAGRREEAVYLPL